MQSFNRLRITCFPLMMAFCFVVIVPQPQVTSAQEHPAINAPKKFAWNRFRDINAEASETNGRVVWETWANARVVFADPNQAPQWPTKIAPRRLEDAEPLLQQRIRQRLTRRARVGDQRQPTIDPVAPSFNEVRLNRATFDFIVANELYNIEGQEVFFDDLQAAGRTDFPIPSQEIKARWEPIEPAQSSTHHTAQIGDELWGLKALHITTKDLPNWFWATWEYKDNPGLEDVVPNQPDDFRFNADGTETAEFVQLLGAIGSISSKPRSSTPR